MVKCNLVPNLVPRVCLFAGYVVACHYITRKQAYSGNEIGSNAPCLVTIDCPTLTAVQLKVKFPTLGIEQGVKCPGDVNSINCMIGASVHVLKQKNKQYFHVVPTGRTTSILISV